MTTVTSSTNTPAANAAASPTGLSGDFNMFLKLLTAQMQNQDPLDPMDTAQYTQQLVQYSQVEQSMQQTSTLKSILSSLGTANLTQASSLIGHEVETGSAAAGLTDSPARWRWSAPRDVTSLVATITDAKGRIVDTRPVEGGASSGSFSWDGKTSSGRDMADGIYTVSFKGADGSGNEVAVTPHGYGTVSDVQLQNGVVQVTINGVQVPSSDLVRIGG